MQFDTRGLKVMLAESDRTVLELLQVRLDVAGYHTCAARTGEGALEVMKNSRPAALIVDLGLPDMSGLDLLQALVARSGGAPFPILVTGKGLAPEHIRRAVGLGARDCMAKPFSGAEILERVARMLRPRAQCAAPRRIAYV